MEAKSNSKKKNKREFTVIRNFSGERSPEQVLAELIKAHSEKELKYRHSRGGKKVGTKGV